MENQLKRKNAAWREANNKKLLTEDWSNKIIKNLSSKRDRNPLPGTWFSTYIQVLYTVQRIIHYHLLLFCYLATCFFPAIIFTPIFAILSDSEPPLFLQSFDSNFENHFDARLMISNLGLICFNAFINSKLMQD